MAEPLGELSPLNLAEPIRLDTLTLTAFIALVSIDKDGSIH